MFWLKFHSVFVSICNKKVNYIFRKITFDHTVIPEGYKSFDLFLLTRKSTIYLPIKWFFPFRNNMKLSNILLVYICYLWKSTFLSINFIPLFIKCNDNLKFIGTYPYNALSMIDENNTMFSTKLSQDIFVCIQYFIYWDSST